MEDTKEFSSFHTLASSTVIVIVYEVTMLFFNIHLHFKSKLIIIRTFSVMFKSF